MKESIGGNAETVESNRIIKKLGLKAGSRLSLRKVGISAESSVVIGSTLEGVIKSEVRVGQPVELDTGAKISNIKLIKENNGRYLVETVTSVYEIQNFKPEVKDITSFKSFKTERGSTYKVLENGKVQRHKIILNDPNYRGEDKGDKPEREPSDVIIFFKPDTVPAGWFNDVGATRGESTVANSINIGIYKGDNFGKFHLIKNSRDLTPPFVFVRVNKTDEFKFSEWVTAEELQGLNSRATNPKNRGLGVIIGTDSGYITNVPTIGYNTFDYKYGSAGEVRSMHNGNKVVSVEETTK